MAWTRRRDAHLAALDVVAAAALLLALAPPSRTSVPLAPGTEAYPTTGSATWILWVAAAVIAAPVALRRFWPLAAFGLTVTASVAVGLLSDLRWPQSIAATAAAALALYSVASTATAAVGVVALVAGVAATAGVGLLGGAFVQDLARFVSEPAAPWADRIAQVFLGCVLVSAAWAIGRATRRQRMYAANTAAQTAQQALSDERQRIARELHDIVAHGMSLIAVKASIANHVADTRPQEAREALQLIETTSRSALVELRRVLNVLRTDDGEPPELDPTPGLGGVAALARRAASAGVVVEVATRDPSSPPDDVVPQGVQLSAYRIVQEALTNVVKHAGPVPCRVAITVTSDTVQVDVADDGSDVRSPPGNRPQAGHGLLGMRERVAAYGGTFTAGPRPGRGYAVRAILPYQPISR